MSNSLSNFLIDYEIKQLFLISVCVMIMNSFRRTVCVLNVLSLLSLNRIKTQCLRIRPSWETTLSHSTLRYRGDIVTDLCEK